VVHPRQKESLRAIILRGTRLPYCPDCNQAIAFCLEQEAVHVNEDADFAFPCEHEDTEKHEKKAA